MLYSCTFGVAFVTLLSGVRNCYNIHIIIAGIDSCDPDLIVDDPDTAAGPLCTRQ